MSITNGMNYLLTDNTIIIINRVGGDLNYIEATYKIRHN
jgi:hypothetical protein